MSACKIEKSVTTNSEFILSHLMQAIKRLEAEKGVSKGEQLPISPKILNRLKEVWSPSGHTHDIKMIWAACMLAFFAFLWAGEMRVPNNQAFNESSHLSISDVVADDDASTPTVLQIKTKQYKNQEKNLHIMQEGPVQISVCTVAAILNYLSISGMSPGLLFQFEDGHCHIICGGSK